ncbi:hypothetical protein [Spongiactinospora sp. 9N601]
MVTSPGSVAYVANWAGAANGCRSNQARCSSVNPAECGARYLGSRPAK